LKLSVSKDSIQVAFMVVQHVLWTKIQNTDLVDLL